jgi:hypothetical protein
LNFLIPEHLEQIRMFPAAMVAEKDRDVQTQNRWERDWGDSMVAEKDRDVL